MQKAHDAPRIESPALRFAGGARSTGYLGTDRKPPNSKDEWPEGTFGRGLSTFSDPAGQRFDVAVSVPTLRHISYRYLRQRRH